MFEGRVLVGRYQLLSKLGSGGMGSVWRARDLTLNADVAVKLIEPQHASSQEALTRFRREAQAAAAIRSTYVVQIIDYGIDRDEPFIAMELLVGDSLAQRLARVGKLSPEATGNVFGHVGRALSLAHEREIVHRDLKPDNVFLVREGHEDVGKVLDFGIARALSLGESGGGVATRTGTVLGSPYYMSPEQASGQDQRRHALAKESSPLPWARGSRQHLSRTVRGRVAARAPVRAWRARSSLRECPPRNCASRSGRGRRDRHTARSCTADGEDTSRCRRP